MSAYLELVKLCKKYLRVRVDYQQNKVYLRKMITIPALLGWIALGGAFDYFNLTPKSRYEIFDYNAVNQSKVFTPVNRTESKYMVVGTLNDAFKFLDVGKDLGLKAIGGGIPFRGYGSYLSHYVDRSMTCEVLFMQEINTGSHTFPQTIPHGQGWQGLAQNKVGTHFVSGLELGGQLFISVQFTATKPEHIHEVRQAVINSIRSSETIFEELQAVADSLGEKCIVSLGAYSTVAAVSVPDRISDLRYMVEQHPEVIENINGGRGRPLKIHLQDIHSVQSNFTEFKVNEEVIAALDDIEKMYDDLRNANHIFKEWDEDRSYLSPEQERKIKHFLRRFGTTYRTIQSAINNLDVTGSPSQFDHAKDTYDYDGEKKFNRYTVEVRELIKSLDENSLPLLDDQDEARGY